jgi:hypothetical protein
MPHRRFLSSIFVDQHGKQASFYAEVAGKGVVLPKHENAFKSWMLPSIPHSCEKQWAAADAPEGLGFTFAAPISDSDAAPPDGGASNLNLGPQAGDQKGSWTICPVFILGKPKPAESDSSKHAQKRPNLVHPFLSTEGSGLARFDSEQAAKSSRLLVTGPVVDIHILAGDHLQLHILDDRDDKFFTECGVPFFAGTQANRSSATSAAVTRQLGR